MSYSAKQKKVKASVEGADKLVKRLKGMEEAATQVLLKGAKAGGEIALNDAKRNCPVDTGTLKASLKLVDGKVTNTKATVQVDYDKNIKYGTFVELGSKRNKPNPFLRNAVDSNQTEINNAIVRAIADAVGGKM